MAYDSGSHDNICIKLNSSVYKLFGRTGCTEIMNLHTILFNSAMLNINDLTKTDGMLILTDGRSNDLHRATLDICADNIIGEHIGFLGDDEGININRKGNFTLNFDTGAVLGRHDLAAYDFTFG